MSIAAAVVPSEKPMSARTSIRALSHGTRRDSLLTAVRTLHDTPDQEDGPASAGVGAHAAAVVSAAMRFGLITRAPSQTCAVELLERPFCHPHFRCTITTSAEPLNHLALSPDLRSRPHGDSFASDSAATSSSSSLPHNAVVSFTDRLVLCHGNRLCAECVYLLAA